MAAASYLKEVSTIERKLRPQGWTLVQLDGGHLQFVGPDGERVTTSASRAGGRALANLRATLKRNGAKLDAPTQPRRRARTTPPSEPALRVVPSTNGSKPEPVDVTISDPEPLEVERTPADLTLPIVACRSVGHAWDPHRVDDDDRRPAFGVLVLMKCLRCDGERRDLVQPHTGAVLSRSYSYPEGYSLHGRHERSEFRVEWLDRVRS